MSELDEEVMHLGATLVEIQAYTGKCYICKVQSDEVVGDKEYILTHIRIHNQKAKHIMAYGNLAIDRNCPVCNAKPDHPCTQGKYPFQSGFHIERWGDLREPSLTS
jgi:hypothetical protein